MDTFEVMSMGKRWNVPLKKVVLEYAELGECFQRLRPGTDAGTFPLPSATGIVQQIQNAGALEQRQPFWIG